MVKAARQAREADVAEARAAIAEDARIHGKEAIPVGDTDSAMVKAARQAQNLEQLPESTLDDSVRASEITAKDLEPLPESTLDDSVRASEITAKDLEPLPKSTLDDSSIDDAFDIRRTFGDDALAEAERGIASESASSIAPRYFQESSQRLSDINTRGYGVLDTLESRGASVDEILDYAYKYSDETRGYLEFMNEMLEKVGKDRVPEQVFQAMDELARVDSAYRNALDTSASTGYYNIPQMKSYTETMQETVQNTTRYLSDTMEEIIGNGGGASPFGGNIPPTF